MAFCPHCGKEVSMEAIACPNCGHPLKQSSPAIKPVERISRWWWLLPILLQWVGGLICYLVLKDRNPHTAQNMLILGVVMVAVVFVTTLLFFALFFFFLFTPLTS